MKKTTFLKLAVITSTMLLLASCSFSNEHVHVHTIVPVKMKAATLTAEGYEAHWKCSECGTLFRDETGKQETTLAALVIPKGFAKLNDGTVKTNIGSGTGAFANASSIPVTVNSFYMAMTETTYERWYEVYTWATASERGAKQYTFAKRGAEGCRGSAGKEPTDAKKQPVCVVSPMDGVVWCNAASEMDGKTPVYYVKGTTEFTPDNVLRSAKISTMEENKDANGYRLPTQAEWEYAARGGVPDSDEWKYAFAGTNDYSSLGEFAVYNQSVTAEVGTKKANSAGLYDMTGNVWEWVITPAWTYVGGCMQLVAAQTLNVSYSQSWSWNAASDNLGFRVCFSAVSN